MNSTRGWTLQEMIAPRTVVFYDNEWSIRGDKYTLMTPLFHITGISADILGNAKSLSTVSVAEKMSWAARRETTRIEDTAYCLLGIFDVNMPLLYGEEEKAFRRLQEEILKIRADRSIFAWELPHEKTAPDKIDSRILCDAFATSPAIFRNGGNIIWDPRQRQGPLAVTNLGINARVS